MANSNFSIFQYASSIGTIPSESDPEVPLPFDFAGATSISTMTFDTVLNDADQDIDALMNNSVGGNNSGYWASTTVTFSFADAAADYSYSPAGVTFASAFNAQQMTVTRAVLDGFAKVSGLTFAEQAFGSANATLKFAEGSNISTAFAYYPTASEAGGDAWFNVTDYNAPVLGTYDYHTFIHEIGHALGLKHGHETDGPGAITAAYDSMEYSVMTYRSFSGQDTDGLPFYVNGSDSYAQSLMMLDIAAIQRFYGANFTTNSTNTTYTFSTNTGEMSVNGAGQGTPSGNKVFRTVWDGNGVDTYDLSNYTTNLNLDLTPGGYSDFAVGSNAQRSQLNFGIAGDGAGGYLYGTQYEVYASGHLYNALQYNSDVRSLIENATGGTGNDQITGNAANNSLAGGLGNDTLTGGAGTDTLTGGGGNDVYYIDTYLDQVVEALAGGTDTVNSTSSYIMAANVENLVLTAGAGTIDGLGNTLDNVITGNEARNGLTGGTGNDTINGGGGDDAIDGGVGSDSLVGGDGVDTYYVDNIGDRVVETQSGIYDTVWTNLANYTLPANVEIYISIDGSGSVNGVGNDDVTLMLGNEGNNNLSSLGGNDIVLGRGGNDTIDGGAGSLDILSGGAGSDSLTGGAGHDYFNYQFISDGGDTITDFHTYAGVEDDILDFRPMFFPTFTNTAGITTAAQAITSGHLTYVQSGLNTQVYADADGGANNNVLMATLLNTTAADVATYTLI